MKKADLTIQQLVAFKGMIQEGLSSGVVTINGKDFAVKSETVYLSGWLEDLKNGELLNPANQPVPGFRSAFYGNKLPAGVFHLVEGLRVSFETTKVAKNDANLIAALWASVAPTQFKNGEVSITQGSEVFRSSGTDVTNYKASIGNDVDFRDVVPFVIRPQTNTSINFQLADAAPANVAYKMEYRCISFVETSKS